MQAKLHVNPRSPELAPLKHLNSIESQIGKRSETPNSVARDTFTPSERDKFENKIKFLQSKVKELEFKLSAGDSGVGSSTPFSPFTHKSNRQQQFLLNRYSTYLNNKQIEWPVSDRSIPRLRAPTTPLPSLPHLFQEKSNQQEQEANGDNRPSASPFNLAKKMTIEMGLETGSEGTENQETSRFNTYSHPKNTNYSLFGKPELAQMHPSHQDDQAQELIGEPEHEPRLSQMSKALATGASKIIKEVLCADQTPNEKSFLSVSGFMPGLKRLNRDAVGTMRLTQST